MTLDKLWSHHMIQVLQLKRGTMMLVVSVHSAVLRTERINIDKALRNVLPAQDPFYCCLSLTYTDLPGGGLKPQTMTESRGGRNLGSHLLSSILESSLWNLGQVIWPLLEHTEKNPFHLWTFQRMHWKNLFHLQTFERPPLYWAESVSVCSHFCSLCWNQRQHGY